MTRTIRHTACVNIPTLNPRLLLAAYSSTPTTNVITSITWQLWQAGTTSSSEPFSWEIGDTIVGIIPGVVDVRISQCDEAIGAPADEDTAIPHQATSSTRSFTWKITHLHDNGRIAVASSVMLGVRNRCILTCARVMPICICFSEAALCIRMSILCE